MANARIQLPDRTWREVKAIAARENSTASSVVNRALAEYLRDRQAKISTVDVKRVDEL